MAANIPKVFRIPKPKKGIKRHFKPKKQRGVYTRAQKKRMLAKEIALRRWEDSVKENAIQDQPLPVDEQGIPEEIKYADNLRNAYRMEHYQMEYMDPTPYITNHV